jgi:hypothetical protein
MPNILDRDDCHLAVRPSRARSVPCVLRVLDHETQAKRANSTQRLGKTHSGLATLELTEEADTNPSGKRGVLEPKPTRAARSP